VADAKAQQSSGYEDKDAKTTIAADPVIPYMNAEQLKKAIQKARRSMEEAVKELDFIEAARYRDEIKALEERMEEIKQ
jgi:excinuclease ABC subunit B